MKGKASKVVSRGGLKMIEEAFVLLRHAPATLLAIYYLGALPFVLSLLYFWADMSRGAFADTRLAQSALSVALLFIWMKCWHAGFCSQLLSYVADEPPTPWTAGRIGRMVMVQTAVQPWALVVRPVALLITVPYGWVRAFFENVSILGDGNEVSFRATCRRALAQARLWPMPNNQSLGLLFLFGFFVFVNVGTSIVILPALLKIFFGVETAFSHSALSFLNSTFFVASVAGAYLCMNPVTKAVYVLRCFHGAALHTGADLRVDLRKIRRATLVALWLILALPSVRLEAAVAVQPTVVQQETLNRSIDEVLQRREFVWREPRQFGPNAEKGWLDSFFEDWGKHFKQWMQPAKKWLKQFARWFEDWLRHRKENEQPESDGINWAQPAKWFVIFLVIALAVALVLLWRHYRRPKPVHAVEETAATPLPDLTSEDVTAEQLPEEGWLQLGREMIAKGELRLALRAFYLAGLTVLGSRQWITLARYKTNRDYERELQRRGRSAPIARESFAITLNTFERVWYGRHVVTPETLAEVQAQLEKIRSC